MDLFNKLTASLNNAAKQPEEQNQDGDTAIAEKQNKPNQTRLQDALKAVLAEQPSPLKVGDMISGTIIGRGVATVFIDLGARGTGIIFGREFYQAQDLLRGLNKDDSISGKVVDPENEDGYVELSVKDAGRELVWQTLHDYKNSGATITAKIASANRGGLVAIVEGMQAFLPVSQLSAAHYPRVEGGDKEKIYTELQKFVGQDFSVQVIDFVPQEQKLIISEKAVEKGELSELMKSFSVGDVVEGTVSGVVDFGIFMRFGPDARLEGLVHISELDWQMVQNPSALFKTGDPITAKIIDVQDGRISLSVKALKPDPWAGVAEQYPKGSVIDGRVAKFSPFGAFVELAPNIQALIHISEFGNEAKMKEELQLDKTFQFRVASVDSKEHRMSLKILKDEPEEKEENPQENAQTEDATEQPETQKEIEPETKTE